MASSDASQEAVWIRYLLPELGQQLDGPTSIHGDNIGAIALAKNLIDYKRTRYINVSYHFVREMIANGTLMFNYIPTNEMVADGLTKALTPAKFGDFIDMLGLADDGLEEDHRLAGFGYGCLQGECWNAEGVHSSWVHSSYAFLICSCWPWSLKPHGPMMDHQCFPLHHVP